MSWDSRLILLLLLLPFFLLLLLMMRAPRRAFPVCTLWPRSNITLITWSGACLAFTLGDVLPVWRLFLSLSLPFSLHSLGRTSRSSPQTGFQLWKHCDQVDLWLSAPTSTLLLAKPRGPPGENRSKAANPEMSMPDLFSMLKLTKSPLPTGNPQCQFQSSFFLSFLQSFVGYETPACGCWNPWMNVSRQLRVAANVLSSMKRDGLTAYCDFIDERGFPLYY